MSLQVALLQESFNVIAAHGEAFVAAFYERLFAMYPETRQFFAKTSMENQHHKLLMSLILVIENLNNPDYLKMTLKRLGSIHAWHHVEPKHFEMVGAALIETLAEYLKQGWSPELEAAWGEAYAELTTMMLAGY